MKKPYDYNANPTRQLARKILGGDSRPLHFLDWDYIAQCVHAHRACRKLAEYLKEKIPAGEPLSDEIVCYIVMGVDKDQLINMSAEEKDGEQDG